jgi:hypothetical protein
LTLQKITLITTLIFTCNILFGQYLQVSGWVHDSITAAPIPDAIITVKSTDKIIVSTYSDSKGNFSLKLGYYKGQILRIECRHVSYVTSFQLIEILEDNYQFKFELSPSNRELTPVEIKSKWEVRQQGDTLKYNPEAYKTATTKTVADLLSNIPGFKVLSDGQILFQNRSVTALLIDGDNIADEQYGAINRNLDARAVGSIEVFNNYEKNAVLASARKSGKLAVNLKISDSFKGKVSGNITAGIGIPFRGVIHPSLVRINQKNKQFFFANANNISINPKGDVFKMNSLSESKGMISLEDEPTKLLSDPVLPNNDLPSSFTVNNQTIFASTLGLIKLKQKKEITYRIGYEYDRQRNKEYGQTSFYPDSTQYWKIQDSTGLEKRSNQMSFRIQFRHNQSSKFAGEATGIVLWYRPSFQLGSLISGSITDTTLQMSRHKRFLIQAGYDGALKTKVFGVLQLKGIASYQNNTSNDQIRTNRFNPIFQYPFSDPANLFQDFNIKQKMLYLSLSNYPKGGKKQFAYGVELLHKQQDIEQSLQFQPKNLPSDPSSIRFFPAIQNQFIIGYLNIKLEESKKHKLGLNAKAGAEKLHSPTASSGIANYNLQLRHEWKLGSLLTLQSDASLKRYLPDMSWFGPDTVFQSMQNLVQAASIIEPAKNLNIHSGLSYRKLTGNSYSLQYTFNQTLNDYGWMPVIEPGYNLLRAAPIGQSQQHTVEATFRKFIFPLKGTISINGQFIYNISDLEVNLQPVTNHIRNYRGEIKWASSFTGKFNFEAAAISSIMNISQFNQKDQLESKIIRYDFLYKSVYQPNNKTHLGIEVNGLLFENGRSWAGQLFAERKLSKNTSLQFQWHNIFFTNDLRYRFNTPNSQGYSSFSLVKPYILCKFTWYL